MSLNLSEAFQALKALNEEAFDIVDDTAFDDMAELENINNELEDVEDIIDPEAEDEEEIEDSYVGKVIIKCPVCQSEIFKNADEIVLNDDGELVNIEDECPYCYSTEGFEIIGEVAPYAPVEDETETIETDDAEITVNVEEKEDEEVPEEDELEENVIVKSRKDRIKEHLKKLQAKKVNEDIESINLETDSEIINIEAAPKAEEAEDEMVGPIADETIAEIEAANEEIPEEDELFPEEPEEAEVDIDEFDEDTFDELGESFLRKTYSNVESFRTSNVSSINNKLKVEGVITFTSGKKKLTNFVFEAKDMSKTGKLRFMGENLQIARGRKAFALTGKFENKKFVAESFRYNFTANENGKSSKVYGTLRVSK